MIQVTAPKNDLVEYKTFSKDFAAVIYVSKTGLVVDIDDSKIKKYKTFVIVKNKNTDSPTYDPADIKDMLGYEEALTKEQADEQFEILQKNEKTTKKTNSMHS